MRRLYKYGTEDLIMDNKEKVKGFRIRTLNYIMIFVACILYGFILYETVQIHHRYDALSAATNEYIHCEQLASQVSKGSDTLTEQVRLYIVTGDVSCAEAYFKEAEVDRNRDLALEEMRDYHPNDDVLDYLQTALDRSNDLMDQEIYAMRLVSEALGYGDEQLPETLRGASLTDEDAALPAADKREMAMELVFGESYREAKSAIMSNVDYCIEAILSQTEQTQQESDTALNRTIGGQRVYITLMFIMTIIIFFFITVLIIRPLQVYIKCIGDNRALEIIGSYEFKYLALTYNDIYELNAANEVLLRRQAERDALTGLLNRAAFQKLQDTFRNYPVSMELLLVDVDKFKSINDTYGHEVGDKALRRVGDLLTESFRTTDFVCRIGGDEFCVLMVDMEEEQREVITGKIGEINTRLRSPTDDVPATSLSVGAAFSKMGFDENLYRRADNALYATKERGGHGCSFYTDGADKAQPGG